MKKTMCLILCLAIVLSLSATAFACDNCFNGATNVYFRIGTVSTVGDGLRLREHHSTTYGTIYGSLYTGDTMRVSKKWEDTAATWYYVKVLTAYEPTNVGLQHWVAGINGSDVNVTLSFG